MITVKIQVPDHVAEYIRGKYYDRDRGCVVFPPSLDIYVKIYDLMQKRPASNPVDTGNLEFMLPDRRAANEQGGKSPEDYNYFSAESAKRLGRRMEVMMFAELHEELDENKHLHGIQFKETIYYFVHRYAIESISEDALFKNYYRWRRKQARKKAKRGYVRKKSSRK